MADYVRETLSTGFRNEKHKAQWKSTLGTYAAPLRAKPVDTITTDDVLAVLKPIWTAKAETASRVRGRIVDYVLRKTHVLRLHKGEGSRSVKERTGSTTFQRSRRAHSRLAIMCARLWHQRFSALPLVVREARDGMGNL